MKKTVIMILALLPIFLVIMISFAGRILSLYEHVSVDKIRFVDEKNKELADDFLFELGVGESKQVFVRIFPDLATNKKLVYTSDDEDVCTIEKDGVITGIKGGMATIKAKSEDGSKIDMLDVRVKYSKVTGVILTCDGVDVDTLDISVGEEKQLRATVLPDAPEINKDVIFASLDESIVKIDANGKIIGMTEGQTTISVTTVDGGYMDSFVVNCVKGPVALYFDFTSDDNFVKGENIYFVKVSNINLRNYLESDLNSDIIESAKFRIASGSSSATINEDTLSITGTGIIKIVAYVGDMYSPTYQTELRLKFNT